MCLACAVCSLFVIYLAYFSAKFLLFLIVGGLVLAFFLMIANIAIDVMVLYLVLIVIFSFEVLFEIMAS